MPCSSPMQAYCSVGSNGKKVLNFSNVLGRMFRDGISLPEDTLAVVCGQCMFCRLECSRETAVRCVHESRMYSDNCFVTLTFSEESLEAMCPLTPGGYSLVRKHVQDFMKRLREKFDRGFKYVLRDGVECVYRRSCIRAFGCGEYGGKTARPHYHFCLFNCSFPDRKYWKSVNGFKYYTSECLEGLWPSGHCTVGDFSFETAAYVARYVTKKVTGHKAEDFYKGRLPEFAVYPTRGGGLGKPWFEKYGLTDVFPTDTCVARGVKCKVPRYYDRLRERVDPDGLCKAKELRAERALLSAEDNTYARLLDKEKCMDARIRLLVRKLEI